MIVSYQRPLKKNGNNFRRLSCFSNDFQQDRHKNFNSDDNMIDNRYGRRNLTFLNAPPNVTFSQTALKSSKQIDMTNQ